ncbi:MAG: MFS transporter, partial [Planctomycetia bacterium]|nr:MFS transporter [Planctomycetia bacterium]
MSSNPYESPKVQPPYRPSPTKGSSGAEGTQPVSTSHPPAFWFIFWGEFAERASYYGMRAILPLYLVEVLHFSEQNGASIYSSFKMAAYFLPLMGGFLSDRYIGKYWGIVGFSVPYVLGHFILGIENIPAMIIALTLLAIGSGVTKPNISTLLGLTYDQQRPGQEQLLSAAFRWFYLSINIGALISQFVMPVLRTNFSYRIAFQFP